MTSEEKKSTSVVSSSIGLALVLGALTAYLMYLTYFDNKTHLVDPKKYPVPHFKDVISANRGGSLSIDLVQIKAGRFQMGSPPNESDRQSDERQHWVTIKKPFLIGRSEVTQALWANIMNQNPSYFKNCGTECPVENVSWFDVITFLNRLSVKTGYKNCYEVNNQNVSWDRSCTGYRLPTEAEWEYAARAGTDTPFSGGNCLSSDEANFDGNNPTGNCKKEKFRETTIKVASLVPNDWGLYDIHGNVREMVWDLKSTFPSVATMVPAGADTGYLLAFRGGSWDDYARNCRLASRNYYWSGRHSITIGFRLAKSSP